MQLAGFPAVNHPAIIVTLAIFQGGEVLLDILAYHLRLQEIHRRPGNRFGLAQGNEGFVGRKIDRSVQLQLMIQHRAAALAVEVEIHVIREVNHRGSVGFGREGELEGVVLAPLIMRHRLQVTRIARLAIGRKVQELYGIAADAALPDLILEPLRPAVQVVGTVVDGEGVHLAVQRERALGNAVGESARNLARARPIRKIGQRVGITQNHVGHFSVAVRHANAYDGGAHIAKPHKAALAVF